MKVICIDDRTDADSQLPVDVVFGEIYTVVDNKDDCTGHWYKLAEMGVCSWYSSDGFAPISNITETEFERTYNKELV